MRFPTPWWPVALSDRSGHQDGQRIPFLRRCAVPFALCALLIFCSPFQSPLLNDLWLAVFIWAYYILYTLYIVSLIKKTGASLIAAWRIIFLAFTVVGTALLFVPALIIRKKDYICSVQPIASLAAPLVGV